MSRHIATRHIATRRLAAFAVVAITLGGCLDVSVQSAAPTPGRSPEPTPATTTYQLDTTVWYEGLLLHFDTALATLDERGGPVQVRLRIENLGTEDGELNGRILLQLDAGSDDPPVEPTRESKVPPVPANSIVAAVMTYEVQGVASVDSGAVLVGEAPQHIARVPLTEQGGALVDLEPVALQLKGAGVAGDLRIALRSGVLRWDLPDWSQELAAGVDALTLTYDVSYLGTFGGGFAFTADNIGLRLPDGSIIGPRRDGHSQSIELIGPGKTKKGLFSRFQIPSGATGRFALVVRVGSAAKAIPFILGG